MIVIRVADAAWREDKGALGLIRRTARAALKTEPHSRASAPSKRSRSRSVTILLTDDAELRALNAAFRNRNKPTNVLSFPASAAEPDYVGDIAMAYGVVRRESEEQGKSFAAHAAHLAAHGILHLLGYDHEEANDALTMERLETALLVKFGIADPYAPRPYTRRRKAA